MMISEIIQITIVAYVLFLLMDAEEVLSWYGRAVMRLPWFLYKPLGGCFKCFAGQWALWYYLFVHSGDYNVFTHLYFVCAVIFGSLIINKIYLYVKEN